MLGSGALVELSNAKGNSYFRVLLSRRQQATLKLFYRWQEITLFKTGNAKKQLKVDQETLKIPV